MQRRDEDWLRQAARDPRSRFLPLWQLDLLLRNGSNAELGWVEPADIERLGLDGPPVFLGLMDGAAHFAVDVSALSEPLRDLNLDEPWSFVEARAAAAQLTPPDVGILAQSKAQVDWHRRHRFCGLCGGPTEQGRGGQVRKCTACNTEHFPPHRPGGLHGHHRRRARLAGPVPRTARPFRALLRPGRLHRPGRVHRGSRPAGGERRRPASR